MDAAQLQELINAKEAEKTLAIAAHDTMWEQGTRQLQAFQQQSQQLQTKMQTEGGQNQLKITRLEGMIAAYKELLPKEETPPEPA